MENYLQGSTGAMVATAPSQTPVVSIELQRLEKQLEELAQVSAALENRLVFVMREPEPQQEKNGVLAPPAQSELTVKIRDRVSEAERITYRLSSIMRRLEI